MGFQLVFFRTADGDALACLKSKAPEKPKQQVVSGAFPPNSMA
jgi:hypothetical protein